jgi:hypothetical protein
MTMIQRKFYLPEEMYHRLQVLARATNQTITQALRDVITEGLQRKQKHLQGNANVLLDLASRAEQEGWRGPPDAASNHTHYASAAVEQSLKRIHDYYR